MLYSVFLYRFRLWKGGTYKNMHCLMSESSHLFPTGSCIMLASEGCWPHILFAVSCWPALEIHYQYRSGCVHLFLPFLNLFFSHCDAKPDLRKRDESERTGRKRNHSTQQCSWLDPKSWILIHKVSTVYMTSLCVFHVMGSYFIASFSWNCFVEFCHICT